MTMIFFLEQMGFKHVMVGGRLLKVKGQNLISRSLMLGALFALMDYYQKTSSQIVNISKNLPWKP